MCHWILGYEEGMKIGRVEDWKRMGIVWTMILGFLGLEEGMEGWKRRVLDADSGLV